MEHSAGFLKIVNEVRPRVAEISLAEARERLAKNPKAVLVDVREDSEWSASHAVKAVHLGKGVLELIQASGVLNAASLTSGPVSPGEIVTLIGSGIGPATATYPGSSATNTVLSATSVLFDGNPAPLLLAGPDQINAIVPYEISGQNSTQLFIMNGGRLVGEVPLSVAAATPAIITLDSSGAGPGAILNQDSSVNSPSNPAIRGSEVVLFATGAGVMNPTPVDGQVTGNSPPLPSLPVSVQIGGAAAQVVYAGAAPGLVAGVLQVNCVVPQQGITPSDSAPVVLMVGTAASPLGVVMAIQ